MGQKDAVTVVKTKIVVVGDCKCGKSAFINRYINKTYQDVSIFSSLTAMLTHGKIILDDQTRISKSFLYIFYRITVKKSKLALKSVLFLSLFKFSYLN